MIQESQDQLLNMSSWSSFNQFVLKVKRQKMMIWNTRFGFLHQFLQLFQEQFELFNVIGFKHQMSTLCPVLSMGFSITSDNRKDDQIKNPCIERDYVATLW